MNNLYAIVSMTAGREQGDSAAVDRLQQSQTQLACHVATCLVVQLANITVTVHLHRTAASSACIA